MRRNPVIGSGGPPRANQAGPPRCLVGRHYLLYITNRQRRIQQRTRVSDITIEQLIEEISRNLKDPFSLQLSGQALYRALGVPTAAAFHQAVSRNQLLVSLFGIENRRGRFALTRVIALWLPRCRTESQPNSNPHESVAAKPAAEEAQM